MSSRNWLALVPILATAISSSTWPATSHAEEVNTVAEIRAVGSTVEITVTSSTPFPVRALFPVLAIGDARFTLSWNPPDGRLDTLIFSIPAADFALLPDGAAMSVGYGLAPGAPVEPAAGHVWDFGNLDKSMLQP
jgi:hypothetical protein